MSSLRAEAPTILVFATGGAIGMHDAGRGLEADPGFLDVLEARADAMALRLGFRARVNQLQPAIDSSTVDEESAPKIARALRARVGAMRASAVVVTVESEFLAYVASRLAFELADLGVPVVVTGSELPHSAPDTDAFENLALAIRTATQANPAAPVSVAFGGAVLPAVRVTKFHANDAASFRAERPFGVSPVGVPRPAGGAPTSPPALARVLTHRFTPAVTARDLFGLVAGDPDALVLECVGPGAAPLGRPGLPDALREISKRIPVVAVTQSSLGSIDVSQGASGRQLALLGVISGGDLTVEAAIAKLGFLIDHGYSHDEIAQLMPRNLIGECSGQSADTSNERDA